MRYEQDISPEVKLHTLPTSLFVLGACSTRAERLLI
nr:MAG TPA: hypothetical protein [Caudoviricetes sp.]